MSNLLRSSKMPMRSESIKPGLRWLALAVLAAILLPVPVLAQREIPLKLWMKVTDDNAPWQEQMGLYVTGVPAHSPNLPFRGTVSRKGRTNFYTLKDSLDTQPGYSIRGENLLLGDLNGDGLTDAVVVNTIAGNAPNGRDTIFVYWGMQPEGFDTLHAVPIPPPLGELQNAMPGCLADVNNDGHLDLLSYADPGSGFGEVQVRFGPNIGPTADKILRGDATYRYFGGFGFGIAVADLNADGLNDLVVRGAFGTLADSSWVRVYWGRSSQQGLLLDSLMEIHGGYGSLYPVACTDVNGDGLADLLRTDTGLPISGGLNYHVFVHLGGPQFSATANFKFENPGDIGQFGYSLGHCIVNAGDMNGDGFDDIAIGGPEANYTDGFVFVYGGGPRIDGKFDAAVGSSDDGDFGYSVAAIGDVNGDGLADLLVGAPRWFYGRYQGYWAVILGSKAMTVTSLPPGANIEESEPSEISIAQNYPNPFNPSTTIQYTIAGARKARLMVYDVLGREVATLVNEVQAPGSYQVTFDGSRLASGVYTYRLSVGQATESKLMILVK